MGIHPLHQRVFPFLLYARVSFVPSLPVSSLNSVSPVAFLRLVLLQLLHLQHGWQSWQHACETSRVHAPSSSLLILRCQCFTSLTTTSLHVWVTILLTRAAVYYLFQRRLPTFCRSLTVTPFLFFQIVLRLFPKSNPDGICVVSNVCVCVCFRPHQQSV